MQSVDVRAHGTVDIVRVHRFPSLFLGTTPCSRHPVLDTQEIDIRDRSSSTVDDLLIPRLNEARRVDHGIIVPWHPAI